MTRAPDILLCSGLDPSGGAGFIADTRVVSELGGRPVGVVTALTVQNTTGLSETHACDPEVIGNQLAFLLTDVEVKAVKLGMLGTGAIARAIGEALHLSAAPVIWDPIMYPSRGEAPLMEGDLAEIMNALAPHLTLITPNQRELAVLTGQPVDTLGTAREAALALARRLQTSVLVKGGHFDGPESVDLLVGADAAVVELRGPRIPAGEHVHGTGCALSSAIATHTGRGESLADACARAKQYVAALISHPAHPGRGAGAVR